MELKDTLNLPLTQFPMRANLVTREQERINHWESKNLYKTIQKKNVNKPKFVLHDGPPFTNGDVHIGTALNKILKDIILRYKSMKGFSTPYVPGWDCHGLPIEHKVVKEMREQKKELSIHEIRNECGEFSDRYIEKQRRQFKRLGILADWENEYKTKNPAYEADILRTFSKFVEQGYVYRSKKPVYWSIPCETALAEAEIEYKDHVSESIFVKFPLSKQEDNIQTSVVIWTTTPWTLPANVAIAVHPDLDYVYLRSGNERFIVASARLQPFCNECKFENVSIEKTVKGRTLEHLETNHPFINRKSPIVLADYVTTDSGTGCVHTAPGHGLEDYLTGLKYKLDIYCPLNDKGCYVNDGQVPENLVGITVLESNGKCPANEKVLEILKEKAVLIHSAKYPHQYPHCWRSKTPVIFRAMDQWFISLDRNNIKKDTLAELPKVKWIPSYGENRIRGAVESRPDWCISRQRSWGVPIPAFYDENNNALLDPILISELANLVEREGSNIWFELSVEELVQKLPIPSDWKNRKLRKGLDTLDVWIDSGSSHQAVLKRNENLNFPADIYFEGSDQHRGWFQSSLLISMVTDHQAPYRQVITHGFVVDENKKKISKSDAKPQTADDYVKNYGADVVRMWIASEDYRNDIPVSDSILQHVVGNYRTIRNTLRFQLGNLYDFDFSKNAVKLEKLTALDKWALFETNQLIKEVGEAFEAFEFHKACQALNKFCSTTLSSIYHDILKDRLYTYAPDSFERRSSQTATYYIFHELVRLLAPILTFTADEALAYFHTNADFSEKLIHLEEFPLFKDEWNFIETHQEVEFLIKFRSSIHEKMEPARQSKIIGQSLDAKVTIQISEQDPLFSILKRHEEFLSEYFIVSQVILSKSDKEMEIKVEHADGVRCPRSWRWVDSLVTAGAFGEVSVRCREVLKAKKLID